MDREIPRGVLCIGANRQRRSRHALLLSVRPHSTSR
jgi:hypothetical protein